MKKIILVGLLATVAGLGYAQETGRVISSTPVIQQVGVARNVCGPEALNAAPKSGAGALVGALAGGAIGNAVGMGGGRAAATMLGLIGGAIVGDRIEGPGQAQAMQQCGTQTSYENRIMGYNVAYEYAGKQYNVQMPHDPGQFVTLQISPVGSTPAGAPGNYAPAVTSYAPAVTTYATVETQPVYATVAPAVVYPAYYARP